MRDLIDRQDAYVIVKTNVTSDALMLLKEMPAGQQWIPITSRQIAEEERKYIHAGTTTIYTCPLPDAGEEVLITSKWGDVAIDTFLEDSGGYYFKKFCGDGDVIAWMPLPRPYNR